ncbi:MAG TPA: L,D-transpeptidase [Longimicrobiaceae bacterium]|nr:L,D-transpeptidase [Longimicrobiaceae bacterium]
MQNHPLRNVRVPATAALLLLGAAGAAQAQGSGTRLLGVPVGYAGDSAAAAEPEAPAPFARVPEDAARARVAEAARRAGGRRLVVSLQERRLWWMDGDSVLHTAPAAVGKGTRLEHGGRTWDFSTPYGVRTVRAKAENPVWVPPEWHYVELAQDSAYALAHLQRGKPARLADGSRLEVRGDRIVQVHRDGRVEEIPGDEEVIFGRTLYVPPLGTANRRIEGELGSYKLELGDGYMLHGTPHQDSIGRAATHGCIRLRDEDVEYLYRNVPVGARVYLY